MPLSCSIAVRLNKPKKDKTWQSFNRVISISSVNHSIIMTSFKSATVTLLFISFIGFEAKKCNKKKKCTPETRLFNVSSLEEDHVAKCPGEYYFEEGDSLDLLSPKYPKRYPNKHNCQWSLHAVGCQFSVVCTDLYTKPTCLGPTWTPLTRCEGDYLRFYSDNLQPEVSKICNTKKCKICLIRTASFNMKLILTQ